MEPMALSQIIKFAASLLFVLALMGGLALVMRRFSGNTPFTAPHKRRLKVVEILPLDGRRKAVLIRRDNKEHLVILGTNSETVVERNIESQQDAQIEQ
ncbi:MAG: hypothetical protein CO093_11110 [Alphaproteobacteria bacterium CG_4_9_14_3_um_filter_47_13]|nr:MAG: hypothetical protein CO093_11110 [Alphaproteobacteria bacterium CG_4_9_14_3_um_filter_47_13]